MVIDKRCIHARLCKAYYWDYGIMPFKCKTCHYKDTEWADMAKELSNILINLQEAIKRLKNGGCYEESIECKDCKSFIEFGEQTACKLSEDPHLPMYLYHPSREDFCSRANRRDNGRDNTENDR